MKSTFQKTSLALAVAALFTSPLAFAQDRNDNNGDIDIDAEVNIEKDISLESEVYIGGDVRVGGYIRIDSSSIAIVNDQQINQDNTVDNDEVTNAANVTGNALNTASGNIGVNVTAGDNNQQANAAALSASDASFVFGSADAEIFANQNVQDNTVTNLGNTNQAALSGGALANATGNIGVNISSGNSNQQKNDLAASVAVARMATATVTVTQRNEGNETTNTPKQVDTVTSVPVTLAFAATGSYAGISDQNGDQYLDTWDGALPHPSGTDTGHIDVDDQVQGASDRPQSSGLDANGNPNGDLSDGGSFSYNEQGDIALSGTVTGNIPVVYQVSLATTNNAFLGDSALQNASGNIGVNISAGTNNQQYNGLAISATQAGAAPGGGGGSGGETFR
jgi:hypothetical protein